MKLISHLLLLIWILLVSCNKGEHNLLTKSETHSATSFPEDWIGIWEGQLKIYGNEGLKMDIPMSLDIHPIDNTHDYTWNIIYGEDKEKGLRPYRLKIIDADKGHYLIDEENGILLDNYYIDGLLTSTYEVAGSLITCNNKLIKDELYYEILFGSFNSPRITGDTIIQNDTIPRVTSFITSGIQKAVLKRKKTLSN